MPTPLQILLDAALGRHAGPVPARQSGNAHPLIGAGIGVLVYELLVYVWHRTMHRVHWIWRSFHQMHHSAERLDSYGAFYFSPLDIMGFTFLTSLSLTLVGLSAQAVTYFLYSTMFLGVFQHTNIRTPRWLGYIVQRPESRRVHHGRGIHQYNYSDLPLFDILFGTFRNPAEFVTESGFYDGASAKVPQSSHARTSQAATSILRCRSAGADVCSLAND